MAAVDGEASRWLDALGREGALGSSGDGALLDRFLLGPDAAGEAAFEVLVRRHGPAVLATCRAVLGDDHAAADAFQATFLVLARRAGGVRDRDRLAAWLGRVARRISRRARADAARRAGLERRAAAREAAAVAGDDPARPETAALVRAAVDRLPEADRRLLHLTYWQGKTYEEAAALLRWPVGTVRSRLSRARGVLRGRLARLGLAPALGAAAATSAEAAAAMPPEALILQTARAAARCASGGVSAAVGAGAVPASAAALANGELATMAAIPWKSTAALLATLLGGALAADALAPARPGPPRPAEAPPDPARTPAPPARAEGKSLLANGGVEEGAGEAPAAWTRGAAVPGVEYLWSRDAGRASRSSLGLKKTADRFFPIAQWSQEVPHDGDGPRLKVSAWIKADGATKAILDAQFLDATGGWQHAWAAYVGRPEPAGPPVSHDWRRYEGVVDIPPGTKRIVVAAQIYGPGTVHFDDLAAAYTDEPATDPIGR